MCIVGYDRLNPAAYSVFRLPAGWDAFRHTSAEGPPSPALRLPGGKVGSSDMRVNTSDSQNFTVVDENFVGAAASRRKTINTHAFCE